MAVLTVQPISLAGEAPDYVAANAGGDKVAASRSNFIHVKNGSGGSITVTLDSVVACNQGSDHNIAVAIPAGQERMIGPFDPGRFADSAGDVNISYSGVTSLTIGAFSLA
jgi:hypothetical protein